MARRKSAQAEPAPNENEDQNTEWGSNEAAERERAEAAAADEEDDAEDGEDDAHDPDDFEDNAAEDLAAVSRVDHDESDAEEPEAAFYDEEKGEGLVAAGAVTPRQRIGMDPADAATHIRQSDKRATLNNGQTDHERDNALDPISGTPNPGVTKTVRHSAPGILGASDMSGGLPKADPFAAAGPEVKRVMDVLGKASKKAMQDGKRGHGYVSLKTLNVHKSVMDALVKGGHVHVENTAGGHFNPETGTVYRHAEHREPEHAKD